MGIAFKTDVYKLEGNTVTINGDEVTAPLHKVYKDGSALKIQDVGQFILTIVQDGKDPLVELSWDKVTSYNLKVHGTCKGQTTGMCGKWNDKKKDDMTMPDGKVAESVEAFGTAWAVDDEEECPTPPPIPDICEDFGLATEKAGFEAHVRSVLKVGVLGLCSKVLDITETVDAAVQEMCLCFGDKNCACPVFNQFAAACDAADFNTAGWALKNKNTECAPTCPEGSSLMAAGRHRRDVSVLMVRSWREASVSMLGNASVNTLARAASVWAMERRSAMILSATPSAMRTR